MIQSTPIGQLVEAVATWEPRRSEPPVEFTYVDISSIDPDKRQIVRPKMLASTDAPTRARQLIKAGDILVSTVRPNLNAVAQVPEQLDGATASTGFCVLRPTSTLSSSYLFQWVRSSWFVADMTLKATGQNYPAVSDKIIKESEIPLPSKEVQRQAADMLDRVDRLREKRERSIGLLHQLTQSLFLNMFGDPASNPYGWPIRTIGSLIDSATYGTSTKATAAGDMPVLRMNNLTSTGEIDLGDLKYLPQAAATDRYIVRKGDVLFNRTNSADLVGKTAIYRGAEPLAYAGYLIRVRTNELNHPEYLAAFLNTRYAKQLLRNMCKSIIGMANINARELRTIKIPQPPRDLQDSFAKRVTATDNLRSIYLTHRLRMDELFTSLQSRAFTGEL